jgi:hypothetical protein
MSNDTRRTVITIQRVRMGDTMLPIIFILTFYCFPIRTPSTSDHPRLFNLATASGEGKTGLHPLCTPRTFTRTTRTICGREKDMVKRARGTSSQYGIPRYIKRGLAWKFFHLSHSCYRSLKACVLQAPSYLHLRVRKVCPNSNRPFVRQRVSAEEKLTNTAIKYASRDQVANLSSYTAHILERRGFRFYCQNKLR